MWKYAEHPESDYQAIFLPWFWQDEYGRELPDKFVLTSDEKDLLAQFQLTPQQIAWRRTKIEEFERAGRHGLKAFQQEYPCTAVEAFQTSGDSLFPPELVMAARKNVVEAYGPLVVGIDVAFGGKDRTVITRRRGRHAYGMEVYGKLEPMAFVGKVVEIIKNEKPTKVFIDIAGATGHLDRLRELGYGDICMGVHFGSASLYPHKYKNKRSEMWIEMLNWFRDQPVQIPDDDRLHADLCIIETDDVYDSDGRINLKPKKDLPFSPDCGDSLGLTFAYPIGFSDQKPVEMPDLGIV